MINEINARKYCKEDISKIKNYDLAIADTTQTWECHHMTAIWWNCSKQDLIDNECYYGRKACELIFLTNEEHVKLHKKGKTNTEEHCRKLSEAQKGKTHTEDTRRKMSEAHKGKPSPIKGKKFSEEQRRNISEAHKGKTHTEDTRRKMSEAHKGANNQMYGKHHSVESRRKICAAFKGKHWKLVDGRRVWYD